MGNTVDVKKNLTRRASATTGALALAVAMAGCSGGAAEEPDADASGQRQPSTSEPASKIADPRDASTVEPCALLPAKAATAMGLDPKGEVDEQGSSPNCNWYTANGTGGIGTSVSLSLQSDVGVDQARKQSQGLPDYKELIIAGHPAVRANDVSPMESGVCSIYLGTKQGQTVHAMTFLSSKDRGKIEPCPLSRQALEAMVPTLPPAQ